MLAIQSNFKPFEVIVIGMHLSFLNKICFVILVKKHKLLQRQYNKYIESFPWQPKLKM